MNRSAATVKQPVITFLLQCLRLEFCLVFCGLAIGADRCMAAEAASRPSTKPAATRPVPKNPRTDTADEFFTTGPLPRLHIEIPPAQLKNLNDNPRTPVHATIREVVPGQPDVIYANVGVHLKGGPGSFRKTEDKPALTLNFDKFDPNGSFHGLDKVHLNNSVQDPAYMCEALGSYLFRASGCPAPRVTNGRVWLNGRDLGSFVIKEGFDSVFFKKFFHDKSGNLYEGSFADVDSDLPVHPGERHLPEMGPLNKAEFKQQQADLKEQRKNASAKLKRLADGARLVEANKREAELDSVLDVDRFLTFLACESIVEHWDGYGGNRNNYRIYDDPRSGKLVFLPQGMDQLFQRPDYALFANGALIARATAQTPQERQRYFDRIKLIREHAFAPEAILAELDRLSARIMPLMQEMGSDAVRQHKEQTAQLRQRILERIANIDKQLADPPKPLQFDASGMAMITQWVPKLLEGDTDADKLQENGKPRLRVVAKLPGGVGSWRSTLLLPQGQYTFEGRMKTVAVKPAAGNNPGAGLRISGEKSRPMKLIGSNDWQLVKYNFEVAESLMEVVLVCDLNAVSGEAIFDPGSMVVRKR